ncbi:hypothetical protein CVU75_02705, partial [Candidatus Dependentiae bacterium HGW-Dependentiae-1]
MRIQNVFFVLGLLFIGDFCVAEVMLDEYGQPIEVEVEPAAPIPTPPGEKPVVIIFPIAIPVIGTINLEMTDKGFEGTFADKNKKIAVGPLVIDEAKGLMTFDNKLSIKGCANLFEKKATIGLKDSDLKEGHYILGLTYDQCGKGQEDKPRLEIIPGTPFIIDATDVELQKGEPVKILAYTKIGQKVVTLTLTVQKTQTDFAAQTDTLSLSDLISQLKNTPLSDVQLTKITLSFPDMFNKVGQKGISGVATAVMQKQIIPGVTMADTGVNFQVKKDGTNDLVLDIKSCSVENVGTIKNAKIKATIQSTTVQPAKPPVIILSGELTLSSGALGQLAVIINSELKEGVFEISGSLAQPFTFAGVSVTGGEVTYNSKDKSLSVTGATTAYGYKGRFIY